MTPTEQADYRARRGTAEDIINLVSIYSQLDAQAKRELLTAAVELLAAQRVRGQKRPDGEPYDAADWLDHLAADTYPGDENAARLLQRGFDVHADGREIVFADGLSSIAMGSSEDDSAAGDGLYEGYLMIANDAYPLDLPSAVEFFGIRDSKRDYVEYEYPETEEEWKAGIRDQCVTEFTGFVSLWRTKFYGALLSKAWPVPR